MMGSGGEEGSGAVPFLPYSPSGEAAPGQRREGDWDRPGCGNFVFASKASCFKCASPKPRGLANGKESQDKDEAMREENGAEPDSEFMRALKSLGLHNTNNTINEIKERTEDIKADLHKLEGWVQSLIDDLNERVTGGFSAHQDMIDEVEDKVDEIQRSQKEFKGAVNKNIQKHTDDIEALKKAIEDLRGSNEGGLIQHTQATEKPNPTAGANAFQKRIRIGGWSPFGAPSGTRISAAEAAELQIKISTYFTHRQKATWRWERPWLTNFQMIIHVDNAWDQAEVFQARSEIQAILDAEKNEKSAR